MITETYNWETWYMTSQNLMCHRFSPRVEIRTNLETGIIRIYKDDKEVNKIDASEMTMREYEQLLVRTAKEAALLPSINE